MFLRESMQSCMEEKLPMACVRHSSSDAPLRADKHLLHKQSLVHVSSTPQDWYLKAAVTKTGYVFDFFAVQQQSFSNWKMGDETTRTQISYGQPSGDKN